MKLKDEEVNRIRCSIALSVPIVLKFLSESKEGSDLTPIRHLIPAYELEGFSGDINPYFVPADTKDTGKKRVYVNSNGYRIRYLTRKMLHRFIASMRGLYEDEKVVEKKLSQVTNRWVLMKGDIEGNNWCAFVDQLVARNTMPNRENHPPCGKDYVGFDAYSNTYAEGKVLPKTVLDSMTPSLTLTKYTPFLKDVSHNDTNQ